MPEYSFGKLLRWVKEWCSVDLLLHCVALNCLLRKTSLIFLCAPGKPV